MSDPIVEGMKSISDQQMEMDRQLLKLIEQVVNRVLELEARLTKVETELAYVADRKTE
jgi:hypothetical protein